MTRDPRPDEEVASMQFSPVAPATPDPYHLDGLLYCRSCDEPLRPVVPWGDQRRYACPTGLCERAWVPAEEVERQVWARFESLNEDAARAIPPGRRQGALSAVLDRITVGLRPDDLEYEWRD
jgi:hypothetical protein